MVLKIGPDRSIQPSTDHYFDSVWFGDLNRLWFRPTSNLWNQPISPELNEIERFTIYIYMYILSHQNDVVSMHLALKRHCFALYLSPLLTPTPPPPSPPSLFYFLAILVVVLAPSCTPPTAPRQSSCCLYMPTRTPLDSKSPTMSCKVWKLGILQFIY